MEARQSSGDACRIVFDTLADQPGPNGICYPQPMLIVVPGVTETLPAPQQLCLDKLRCWNEQGEELFARRASDHSDLIPATIRNDLQAILLQRKVTRKPTQSSPLTEQLFRPRNH